MVFDTSGEVTWEHSMSSVMTGGRIITCGGHAGRSIPVDVSKVFIKQIDIRGSYLGTRQESENLIAFVVAREIKPHIGLVVSMEEADTGFQKMLSGETAGQILVKM